MPREEELTFRVRGKGNWEQRSMMMKALLMIKGVTKVDTPGEDDFPTPKAKSCSEAEAMEDVQRVVKIVAALLEDPHPGLMVWGEALRTKLTALAGLLARLQMAPTDTEGVTF